MLQRTETIIQFEESDKVELFLSCRKLKNMDILSLTDPQILLYIDKNGKWTQFSETEAIDDNLNPDFAKTIIIDFHFEIKQKLRFEIIDIDGPNKSNFIGEVFTTLGELVGAKNQTSIWDIKDKNHIHGKLIVRCESVKTSNSISKMQVSANNLQNVQSWCFGVFGTNNPFLSFYRSREEGVWVKVHETEIIVGTNNPEFKQFEIKIQKLCNGDLYRPIKVECHSRVKNFKNIYIGEFEFNLYSMINKAPNERHYQLINPKNKSKVGIIKFNIFEYIERPSFLDYIRGGVQLNIVVAIDFTGSNGHPSSLDSLHSIKFDGSYNEYQKAIMGVCEILLNYDHDKRVPVYGFGAKPHFPNLYSNVVSHCFPANSNPFDPYVYALDGIMKTYSECIQQVELAGPTLFAPLITEAMKLAAINRDQGKSMEYTILLILTDGEIHDMEDTINNLIKSEKLPLSIIIIGIGKADFNKMDILDGDEGLYNSEGVKAERDLVQFVPFRKYENSHEMLAAAVLEEVPNQLLEYMEKMMIKPGPPIQIDPSALFGRGNTISMVPILDDINLAKKQDIGPQ